MDQAQFVLGALRSRMESLAWGAFEEGCGGVGLAWGASSDSGCGGIGADADAEGGVADANGADGAAAVSGTGSLGRRPRFFSPRRNNWSLC